MWELRGNKIKVYTLITIVFACLFLFLVACDDNKPVITTGPSSSDSPSQPSVTQSGEPEPEYIEYDYIILYQNGIMTFPSPKQTKSMSFTASDGYTIDMKVFTDESGYYPVYDFQSETTLGTPPLSIPNTRNTKYLIWNQHKIYIIDFSSDTMDMLLSEHDKDISFEQAFEDNKANGLYWGTKPVLSEDGRYLLYLTNRRNKGKTNDIRLYDFSDDSDVLLCEDAYYNHAYISDTTVFVTCEDKIERIEIASKAKALVSHSISPNGGFCYPYYIYTNTYYHEYEILNILNLSLVKGTMGAKTSALKICPVRNDDKHMAAVILLDKGKMTLSFLDIDKNTVSKTYVLSENFSVVYAQWVDNDIFSISGYQGGIHEKTFQIAY